MTNIDCQFNDDINIDAIISDLSMQMNKSIIDKCANWIIYNFDDIHDDVKKWLYTTFSYLKQMQTIENKYDRIIYAMKNNFDSSLYKNNYNLIKNKIKINYWEYKSKKIGAVDMLNIYTIDIPITNTINNKIKK